MLRRSLLALIPATVFAGPGWAAASNELTVYKSPSCGCCSGWVTAMMQAGFTAKVISRDDISAVWRERGVADEHGSCHAAEIGGYVLIGHVPPADVRQLLRQRPRAVGLSAPGMPIGSPGMEQRSGAKEPYATLLLLTKGRSEVFQLHS
jgi:hypothetical protein